MTISKLEETIINHARQSVLEMKTFSGDGVEDYFIRSLHESSALIQLGKVCDSGLSEQAVHELNAVEKEHMQLLRDWKNKAK